MWRVVRACSPVCMCVHILHFADDIPDSTCDWPEPKWKIVEGKRQDVEFQVN